MLIQCKNMHTYTKDKTAQGSWALVVKYLNSRARDSMPTRVARAQVDLNKVRF